MSDELPKPSAMRKIIYEAKDLCWKATPYGEDAEGFVSMYLVPAGVVHRLVGALQSAGIPGALRNASEPLEGDQ